MKTKTPKKTGAKTLDAGLATFVKELSATFDQAESELGPHPTPTTSATKRRTAKPRKGSDRVLALLVPIVEQHGLNSSSLNTRAMMDLHEMAQTLLPLK